MIERTLNLWQNVKTAMGKVLVAALFVLTIVPVTVTDASERIRVGIIPFESKAENVTSEQADFITGIFYPKTPIILTQNGLL
jgi:hypothetical protein